MNHSPSASLTQRTYDVAIVGNDMLLAALPARPVQVFHAVQACGFDLVVPVSWGEEVLADHAMRRLAEQGARPMVFCACPRVRSRLLQSGNELAPHMISMVAPPVAAARYLQALHPNQSLRFTFLGGCDGAADPAIAVRVAPLDFLRSLQQRGIIVTQLPTIFDSIVPPDRRRHWSQPGGVPTRQAIQERPLGHQLAVLVDDDVAARIADHLLMSDEVLMDLAPRVGCACAGSIAVHNTVASREAIAALEPPRSILPVIEGELRVEVELPMPHLEASPVVRPILRLEPPAPAPASRRPPATRAPTVATEHPVAARRVGGAGGGGSHSASVRPRLAITPPGVSQLPLGDDGTPEAPRPSPAPPVELRKLSPAPRPPAKVAEPAPAAGEPSTEVAPSVRRPSPAFGLRHVARASRAEGQLPRAALPALRAHRAPTPAGAPDPAPPIPQPPPPAPAPPSPAANEGVPGLVRPPEPPAFVERLETQATIEPVVTPASGVPVVVEVPRGGAPREGDATRARARASSAPQRVVPPPRSRLWGLLASLITIAALTIVLKLVLDR